MKFIIVFVFFLSLGLFSCKKDRLKGDKAILIGDWHWIKTEATLSMCDPPMYSQTFDPNSDGKNYSMKLEENGMVSFYEDNNVIDKQRIVFNEFYFLNQGYVFSISLDNNDSERFLGLIYESGDSLFTYDFPYKSPNEYCEEYTSYFVRQ